MASVRRNILHLVQVGTAHRIRQLLQSRMSGITLGLLVVGNHERYFAQARRIKLLVAVHVGPRAGFKTHKVYTCFAYSAVVFVGVDDALQFLAQQLILCVGIGVVDVARKERVDKRVAAEPQRLRLYYLITLPFNKPTQTKSGKHNDDSYCNRRHVVPCTPFISILLSASL